MSTVVFTFGRFQPPTKGHELLISKVVETAKQVGGDHVVYLSQTQRVTTDPLEWNFKRRVCEAAFRGVNISNDLAIRNPFIALEHLKEHYDRIIMVAGSDQANDYKKFSKYTEEWGVNFLVLTAGMRIDESDGVEGISGTKMRQFALDNSYEKFRECLPAALNENISLLTFKNVRKGLKVR